MNRKLAGGMVVVMLVLSVGVFYAIAAEMETKEKEPATPPAAPAKPAAPAAQPAPPAPPAPGGPAATPPSTMTPEEMLARSEQRMKENGASDGMIMRNRQIQTAKFSIDEPIGLLALKDKLNLTPEQVKKIEGIAETARKDAKAALTKEQAAMLDQMKDTPDSAMGVSAQFRGMFRRRSE